MKQIITAILCISLFYSCDVDQKKEMELPEVDVDVDAESGQLPTFDVDWADVNVGTRTKMVEVPKVVVVMEEVEVEVPYIDVDMPEDDNDWGDKMEQTIMVEAEVTDYEHELDIKEIRASGNTLYVIAELEKGDQEIGDKKMRVSDQVSLNAPELNVKYMIVGERPDRMYNSRYRYYNTMNDAVSNIKDAKVIYSD